jgi:hypothetical protein
LENTGQKKVKRVSQLWEMNNSESFQNIVFHDFTHKEFRKCSNDIKDKEASEVVITDL